MAIDERLRRKLEEVLGAEEARSLMTELGARGITRRDLQQELLAQDARFDAKLGGLEDRFDAKLGSLAGRFDAKLGSLEDRFDAKLGSLEDRFDAKLQLLEARMDVKLAQLESRFLDRIDKQTHSFVRTFYISNSVMVLAVAGLAFGAAKLA